MPYGTQNQYTEPPPAYAQVPHVGTSAAAREPLLDREVGDDDVPDDFKYGVSVSECDLSHSCVKFIPSCLCKYCLQRLWQLLRCIMTISRPGTILILFGLIWKRRSYPTNFILLSTFTLAEAYTVGTF
ncbi:14676_t:CDS:2, partial [Entrophospora sp. SA101]